MKRCSILNAHYKIERWEPFKTHTGSLYGKYVDLPGAPRAYVVYSFGDHWPLLVGMPGLGVWINAERYGMSTDRHAKVVRRCFPAAHATDVCGLHHVLKNLPHEYARRQLLYRNGGMPDMPSRELLTQPIETS